MENAIRHNKTPEERKAALEEALRRVRPVVLGHNEPVGKRLEQFANRPIDEQTKTSDRKKALKHLSLAEMAKKGTELEKKAEKAGIDLKGPGLAKDIDEKNKEKKKEKEKDKEKELTPEKQEQKMKDQEIYISFEGISHILDEVEKARRRLIANVNFEVAIEMLLVTIKENGKVW